MDVHRLDRRLVEVDIGFKRTDNRRDSAGALTNISQETVDVVALRQPGDHSREFFDCVECRKLGELSRPVAHAHQRGSVFP